MAEERTTLFIIPKFHHDYMEMSMQDRQSFTDQCVQQWRTHLQSQFKNEPLFWDLRSVSSKKVALTFPASKLHEMRNIIHSFPNVEYSEMMEHFTTDV